MPESTERVRWRMTLDELADACKVDANVLEEWATLGALGDRWKEPRLAGKWRHITRDVAQRAVIMSRLRVAGIEQRVAVKIVNRHQLGHDDDIVVSTGPGVLVRVSREELP